MKWMKCSIADSLRPEPIRGDCNTRGSFWTFPRWERGNGDVAMEKPECATGAKSTSFCTKKYYIPWITLVLSWTTLLGLGFICHTYKRLYISLQCSSFRRKPQLLLIYICSHSPFHVDWAPCWWGEENTPCFCLFCVTELATDLELSYYCIT